ncbi:MAG TPA: molybdenum cofactor biosynthesis protein MoaE [Thermoanaerobaculia bacterium]|nr:molybdenum cofactor biosynthesis protein MoaE [Thermoanaerobaculia bacterium]
MRVHVLAFATAAEALGAAELELELPEGSSLADLVALLERRGARLAGLWDRVALAVDGELATPDRQLFDGAEVALLPPVSGGAPHRAELTERALDPAALAAAVQAPSRGAVALFVGTVRDSQRGRPVRGIDYAAYRPMAQARLEAIAAELEAGDAGLAVRIAHRLGSLAPGEASVVIAAASPHREAAFAACRAALERLKREAPIWKREHYGDGEAVWREEEPLAAPAGRGAHV